MGAGEVVQFRKGQHLRRQNERAQIGARLALLLRRRTLCPLDGRRVWIEFATEAEARECQKMIVELGRRRRRAG